MDHDQYRLELKIIQKEIFGLLSKNKFIRNKSKFLYRQQNDIVCVIDLQKSDYSFFYYLNIGIWFNAIRAYPVCAPYKCPLDIRATSIPEIKENCHDVLLNQLLDVEKCFTVHGVPTNLANRVEKIKEIFDETLLPFLDKLSLSFLRHEYAKKWFHVAKDAISLFREN